MSNYEPSEMYRPDPRSGQRKADNRPGVYYHRVEAKPELLPHATLLQCKTISSTSRAAFGDGVDEHSNQFRTAKAEVEQAIASVRAAKDAVSGYVRQARSRPVDVNTEAPEGTVDAIGSEIGRITPGDVRTR